MKHRHARSKIAALGTLGLIAPLLIVTATSTQAAVTGSSKVSLDYTCVDSIEGKSHAMPLAFDVTATPAGSATRLSIAGGEATLEDDLTITSISSTLLASAGGTVTTLSGSATNLVITAGVPFSLPSLTGTANVSGTSTTFTPGAFSVTLKTTLSGFIPVTLTLDCAVSGVAPDVTLGTITSPTPTPTPTATPSAKPTAKPTVRPAPRAVRVKVKLAKKTVRVGAKRQKVAVRVLRRTAGLTQPAGTVKVKLGKRTVATTKAAAGRPVRVALPRRLKVGRHSIKVSFTPSKASRTQGHLPAAARTSIKVRR